jgi:hypothetical protein
MTCVTRGRSPAPGCPVSLGPWRSTRRMAILVVECCCARLMAAWRQGPVEVGEGSAGRGANSRELITTHRFCRCREKCG